MLTADMQRIVREQRLGFVATVGADGVPSLSPKGTFVVIEDTTLAFGEMRSPGTLRNLAVNPAVEVNFVDPFARKGYRFRGEARIVARGTDGFEALLGHFGDFATFVPRMRAVVTIAVTRALPLVTPAYDDGTGEAEIRRQWTRRFRTLQPTGRFEE